jgi:hypothetical protein
MLQKPLLRQRTSQQLRRQQYQPQPRDHPRREPAKLPNPERLLPLPALPGVWRRSRLPKQELLGVFQPEALKSTESQRLDGRSWYHLLMQHRPERTKTYGGARVELFPRAKNRYQQTTVLRSQPQPLCCRQLPNLRPSRKPRLRIFAGTRPRSAQVIRTEPILFPSPRPAFHQLSLHHRLRITTWGQRHLLAGAPKGW